MSTQSEFAESADSCAPVGALVFLRGNQGADLAEIHSSLSQEEGVIDSNPVLGNWNIVLRLVAKNRESLSRLIEKQILSLKNVAEMETHYCEETPAEEKPGVGNEPGAATYAILDVDSDKVKGLSIQFKEMPDVTRYDVTDSGRQIILKLAGKSTGEIRNILSSRIRMLPGVLRIKQLHIL